MKPLNSVLGLITDQLMLSHAVSEIPTSMSLQVNNIDIDNFNYQSINDPILASEDYFNNQISWSVCSSIVKLHLAIKF